MTSRFAYYNDNDPYCCAWLRNLIATGLIPDGEVDDRSIKLVGADDLRGFRQVHFFAGIAGWSRALQLAGWPEDREIWTGSCPCQPFSVAGKGRGADDDRHLWPDFFRLIKECRPALVMGEQVAGSAGYRWLDGVCSDLEGEGYSCGAADIPACAVDAPHIRSRLYWVAQTLADADAQRRIGINPLLRPGNRGWNARDLSETAGGSSDCILDSVAVADADDAKRRTDHSRWDDDNGSSSQRDESDRHPEGCGPAGFRGVDQIDTSSERRGEGRSEHELRNGWNAASCPGRPGVALGNTYGSGLEVGEGIAGDNGSECSSTIRTGRNSTFWSDAEWITGADGKARRVPRQPQSGVRELAHGLSAGMAGLRSGEIPLLAKDVPARIGKLRALGNAIVPDLAAEVISALLDWEAA
jgi:DNA (cytosine-5)-methyltransferase 1